MNELKTLHISVCSDGFSDSFYLRHLVEELRANLGGLEGLRVSVASSLPENKPEGDFFWEIHGSDPSDLDHRSDYFSVGAQPSSRFVVGSRPLCFSPEQTSRACMAYRASKLAVELALPSLLPSSLAPDALYPQLSERILVLVPSEKFAVLHSLLRKVTAPLSLYFPEGNPSPAELSELGTWLPENIQVIESKEGLDLISLVASARAYLSLSSGLYPDSFAVSAGALGKCCLCHLQSGTRSLLGSSAIEFDWENPNSLASAAAQALHTRASTSKRALLLARTAKSFSGHISKLFKLNQYSACLDEGARSEEARSKELVSAQELLEQTGKSSFNQAGFFFIQEGRTAEASAVLKEALNRGEAPSISSRLLAVTYFRNEETEAALRSIEQAIAFDPNDFENYRIKGEIFEVAGDLAESKACFRKVLEIAPQERETLVRFLNCSGALGDWSDVKLPLEAYLANHPSDHEIKSVYQSVCSAV